MRSATDSESDTSLVGSSEVGEELLEKEAALLLLIWEPIPVEDMVGGTMGDISERRLRRVRISLMTRSTSPRSEREEPGRLEGLLLFVGAFESLFFFPRSIFTLTRSKRRRKKKKQQGGEKRRLLVWFVFSKMEEARLLLACFVTVFSSHTKKGVRVFSFFFGDAVCCCVPRSPLAVVFVLTHCQHHHHSRCCLRERLSKNGQQKERRRTQESAVGTSKLAPQNGNRWHAQCRQIHALQFAHQVVRAC